MKRILFVDDEPGVLDGLRRLLRPKRSQWEMVFVGSGEEALRAMQHEPFDVLVTDMKMPGMDGAALLQHVVERHPGTVRIVMTGHSDLEASLRSVRVSHQFLTKPCDPDVLQEVIDRACDLDLLLKDPALQAIVGDIGELPVLPRTYQALATALADPEVDMGLVGRIVEGDPAIAAKILQLVNSSFFAVRKEITDLRQATVRLGVQTIRDLFLTFEVFRQFDGAARVPGFSIESVQGHALRSARIARLLLPDRKPAEYAFLAAMMQDLGMLVLVTSLPNRLARARRLAQAQNRALQLVEEELFGVSHAEIGAYLLGLWGMPYPVIEAVAHHHAPGRVPGQVGFGPLGAVHVASCLAQAGDPIDGAKLDEGYLRDLGVADNLSIWRSLAAGELDPKPVG